MVKLLLPALAAWCPSSPPVPPQGAPGGSGQLGTPRVRPSHQAPQPPPRGLKRAASKVADSAAVEPPGTALHLKNKYGSGYHVDVTSTEATHADVGKLIGAQLSSGHRPVGATQFAADVPLTNVAELQALCAAVEGSEGKRLQMDISVSMCTLENVFIKIAHQAKDPEALALRKDPSSAGGAAIAMVSISCPVGKKAGDAVQIVHEGASYDLTVPDGIAEGQSFQVALPAGAG